MGVSVVYTYAIWSTSFPQFWSTVTEAAFDAVIFPLAQQYCPNDGSGQAQSTLSQTNLLGLMCSHIAQLLYGTESQGAAQLVGRISNATEGSVSVTAEMPPAGDATQAWLQQTQFGLMYWAACAPYRTMQYVAGPRRRFSPRYRGY